MFAQEIPGFATRHPGEAMAGILQRGGLEPGAADRLLCHRAGADVVAETALSPNHGTLDVERDFYLRAGDDRGLSHSGPDYAGRCPEPADPRGPKPATQRSVG